MLGVDYPWTHYPTGPEDVAALDCTFPAILKPAIKRGYNRFTGAKAWRVENHAELQARYAEACTLTDPALIMIQELVPGGGEGQFSYAAICKDGRVLASLVARRTRQYPIDFGLNSTFVETVDEPGIEEPARRLLAALAYTGAIEVEFKRDPASGAYKLLDVNARLWAWHTLGERAGVDFTYLIWRLIHNLDIPETRARRGVRWVSLVGDLHAAASEIRRGRLTPSGYLRSLCGPLQPATFALDDPLPALVEGPLLWYLLSKRPGFSETAWLGGLWRGFTGTLHSPSRHVPA
jgi:D-aspartate ligase